ncbi:unnamed protein product, partial [Choristocarpus tenellus]
LLGFSFRDHYSCPAPEAFLDPHQPSDPPRKHLAVIADLPPPPLLRPQWQRVVWGPPAMEVARGGKLEIQVWARETGSEDRAWGLRRWRRGSARAGVGGGLEQVDSSDGSWLVGFASLDGTDVCRLVTGRAVELPLRKPSPPKRGTSPETTRVKVVRRSVPVGCGGASVSAGFVVCGRVRGCWCGHCCCCGGGGLVRALTTRMGKETTSDGRGYQLNRKGTGTGEGAQVHRDLSVDFGSDEALGRSCEGGRGGKGGGSGSVRQEKIVGEGAGRVAEKSKGPGGMSRWFRVLGREEGEVFSARTARLEIVGSVKVSLGLRDKSMVLMRVLRQWNMGRDEASVLQRRAAQEEARR